MHDAIATMWAIKRETAEEVGKRNKSAIEKVWANRSYSIHRLLPVYWCYERRKKNDKCFDRDFIPVDSRTQIRIRFISRSASIAHSGRCMLYECSHCSRDVGRRVFLFSLLLSLRTYVCYAVVGCVFLSWFFLFFFI